jgi:hypothetical protein
VPTTVGFVFLMLDADISSETLVPLSLREKLSMFMFADLIESEVRLLGISPSGMEALIPEALGISRSTVETIRNEMNC